VFNATASTRERASAMFSRDAGSWKQWSGREEGEDKYKFGDVGRKVSSKLWPQLEKIGVRRKADVGENNSPQSNNTQESPPSRSMVDTLFSLKKTEVESAVQANDTLPSDSRRSGEQKGSAKESQSLDSAVAGLQKMRSGLKEFDNISLINGADALAKIRMGLEELQIRVEENVSYQQKFPESGALLQVQVCSAAGDENPPDWSMGQLYTSTEILFFESNDAPPWSIGPVRWDAVASLQKFQGGDLQLVIKGEDTVHLFTGLNNMEVLEKLGGLTDAPPAAAAGGYASPPSSSGKGADDVASLPLEGVADGWLDSHGGTFMDCIDDDELPEVLVPGRASFQPMIPENEELDASEGLDASGEAIQLDMRKVSDPGTASYDVGAINTASFAPAADALANAAPKAVEPSFNIQMPKATIEGIRTVLGINRKWPLRVFLEGHMKITDVVETPWAPSKRVSGTLMRRLRFVMPVPADVPNAVKKLIKLPSHSTVTMLARLGGSADRLLLLTEVQTHDVTYGDNFWVQDVLSFRSDTQRGGVVFEKFTTVRWVVALPWYAGVLGTFIEMKAKEDSKTAGVFLAKYLEDKYDLKV